MFSQERSIEVPGWSVNEAGACRPSFWSATTVTGLLSESFVTRKIARNVLTMLNCCKERICVLEFVPSFHTPGTYWLGVGEGAAAPEEPEPELDEPAAVEPGAVKPPLVVEPAGGGPTEVAPGETEPGDVEPGEVEPGDDEPGAVDNSDFSLPQG